MSERAEESRIKSREGLEGRKEYAAMPAIEDASNELNERITEADENLRGNLPEKQIMSY